VKLLLSLFLCWFLALCFDIFSFFFFFLGAGVLLLLLLLLLMRVWLLLWVLGEFFTCMIGYRGMAWDGGWELKRHEG